MSYRLDTECVGIVTRHLVSAACIAQEADMSIINESALWPCESMHPNLLLIDGREFWPHIAAFEYS